MQEEVRFVKLFAQLLLGEETDETNRIGDSQLAREAWRTLEEFNLNPGLALEALFVQLKRVFSSALVL